FGPLSRRSHRQSHEDRCAAAGLRRRGDLPFRGMEPSARARDHDRRFREGAAGRALHEGGDGGIPAGGDGTNRAGASALAGTSTPMGIVPLGTGNLLARNIDLVLDKTEWALRIALWGRNREIDVGTAKTAPDGESQIFTV